MKEIDVLNSWETDLDHKTGYCGPQRPKRAQKSIGQCARTKVGRYIPTPMRLRAAKFETEARYILEGVQKSFG